MAVHIGPGLKGTHSPACTFFSFEQLVSQHDPCYSVACLALPRARVASTHLSFQATGVQLPPPPPPPPPPPLPPPPLSFQPQVSHPPPPPPFKSGMLITSSVIHTKHRSAGHHVSLPCLETCYYWLYLITTCLCLTLKRISIGCTFSPRVFALP